MNRFCDLIDQIHFSYIYSYKICVFLFNQHLNDFKFLIEQIHFDWTYTLNLLQRNSKISFFISYLKKNLNLYKIHEKMCQKTIQ